MTKIGITLWRSLLEVENGIDRELTWEQLGKFLSDPIDFIGEKETGGWSAASFVLNKRDLEHVALANALVLDFDGTAIRDVLTALFGGAAYYVHASKRNSKTSPRYRAVLKLSRSVNAEDYYRVWRAYTIPFSKRVDQACKDPSRFWYRPCKTPETLWEFWEEKGNPLDVEALIAEAKAIEEKEAAARKELCERMAKVIQLRPDSDDSNRIKRASRYIEKMDPAISGSGGHRATWAVACVLVKGFSLDRDAALALMASEFNPRCQPPWSRKELEHKVDQAIGKTRKLPDGYLLSDRDGWTPARRAEIPPIPDDPDPEYVPEPPPGLDDPDGIPAVAGQSSDETSVCSQEAISWQAESKDASESNVVPPARERYGAISAQQLCLDVLTDVNRPPEMGCPTGVGDIDVAMFGMRPETITVLAGSTSIGKTSLSIMSSEETMAIGRKPLILTYEDAPLLFGRRMVARRAKLNFVSIRNRDTSMRERGEIIRTAGAAQKVPLLVDCRGKTAEYGAMVIRDLVAEEGIDLVIVDYLQRIRTEHRSQDRRNQITFVMDEISTAIKLSGAAGLILSQLKRLQPGNIPTMEDIKESGDVECFTENIILGWREIQRDGTEEKYAILAKNKEGPVVYDPIRLNWNTVSACFIATDVSHPADSETDRALHHWNEDIDEAITGR